MKNTRTLKQFIKELGPKEQFVKFAYNLSNDELNERMNRDKNYVYNSYYFTLDYINRGFDYKRMIYRLKQLGVQI